MTEPPSMERLKAVKSRHESAWLAFEGVVAVGIGRTSDRGAGLVVSVREAMPELVRCIPREVEGVPVEVRETGAIRPL